jgi:predicted CoA-substrate-specific enzyme activase
VASGVVDQGVDQDGLALGLLEKLLTESGLRRSDIGSVVATGYGRKLIRAADATITEVTCQGRGVRRAAPEARTVIDIGGQDSKLLRLRPDGTVADFAMNDRCAAGTGRFLETMAQALGLTVEEFGDFALGADGPSVRINSMCTVFAESEVVSLLARNQDGRRIALGLHEAITERVANLGRRVGCQERTVFSGGVALNRGVVKLLGDRLGVALTVPPQPQIIGALGAALYAEKRE